MEIKGHQSIYSRGIKRSLDVVGATLVLALFSPVLISIASVLLCTSSGPIFFSHRRVGRHGREIRVHKFRTMMPSCEVESPVPHVTLTSDRRITPFGRFLRNFKLDELPQLVNILTGDMSFVGPRPQVQEYIDQLDEVQRLLILSVRPGLTDPSSLKYVRESEILENHSDPRHYYEHVILPDKAAISSEYALSASFSSDIKLAIATCVAIFRRG